jgi:F0F1-type ATP synthase assembly protein I
MKWIPVGLIIVGLVVLARAFKGDRAASFEDGSFLLEIVKVLAGIALIVAGLVWLAISAFMALP